MTRTIFGIPYQGSKGKSAPKIFRAIANRHDPSEPLKLYDPFCGGFAVSHYFRLNGWETVSSDLDGYTVSLLRSALVDDLGPITEEWITRERFKLARDFPEESGFTDSEVGYVRSVWSFGNAGTKYLYGKDIEHIKKSIFELVFYGTPSEHLEDSFGIPLRALNQVSELPSPRARYRGWRRSIRFYGSKREDFGNLMSLGQGQIFERLSRIKQLSKVNTGNVSVENNLPTVKDYRDVLVEAEDSSTIYLDPPYAGTEGYAGIGTFDHQEFWELASEKSSRGAKVYVSEYTAPEGWEPVLSFTRPNKLAADSKSKSEGYHRERLYSYRPTSRG